MADRKDSDREVLTSLPRSRPVRRSAKRAVRPDAANGEETTARPATKATRSAAAKPRAKAAAKATAKTGPRATAKTGPRPTAKTGPKATAKTGPRATPKPRPGAIPGATSNPRRKIPPAGYAAPTSQAPDDHAAASADLIATAVQAAGELAQIGFAVGRQALHSMLDRLPKP